TASVGDAPTGSGRSATSMRRGPSKTAARMVSTSWGRPNHSPSVQRILDAMAKTPAHDRNGPMDILYANQLGCALGVTSAAPTTVTLPEGHRAASPRTLPDLIPTRRGHRVGTSSRYPDARRARWQPDAPPAHPSSRPRPRRSESVRPEGC